MKRTRITAIVALLTTLVLSGCGGALLRADAATADDQSLELALAERYPFKDFPKDAYPAETQTAKGGKVTPVELETDLFQAKFEGDEVSGSGGAVGGAYHFIAEKTDGEAWHVKLECNYPTVAGRDYFVTYNFRSDVAGTVKFGDFQEFQIQAGENSITGVFTATSGQSYLDLQLGMLPAFTIDFTSIEVKEYADEASYENALAKPVDFTRASRVYEKHDEGYSTYLSRGENAVNVNYISSNLDSGVWKSRLYVKTGMVPELGTHYRVTADVMSDQDMPIELLFNDGDVEKGYGALYGLELEANKVTPCEAVITGVGNGDELVLQFSLGEAPEDSMVTVGNVHVEKIVDQYTSMLPEDFALDSSVATGKIIDELIPVDFRDLPRRFSYSSKDTVYEQHDDGYVVNLKETADTATLAITRAPANPDDRGVWKVRLYAATGVNLQPNMNYLVKFDLDSKGKHSDYEVVFDGDYENAYGALYGRSLEAGGTDHVEQLITPDASHGPLTVRVQLGKTDTAAGNTVRLRNFSVEAVKIKYKNVLPASFSYDTGTKKPDSYKNVLPKDFSYSTDVNVFERHADGYTQSVSASGKTAKLNIKKAPSKGRDLWNSNLLINTGFTPKAGQKYLVTFDIVGKKDQPKYEVCYDGDAENAYGALYDKELTGGKKQTISHSFTPEKSAGPLVLRLQLGQTKSTSGNVIKVSNIQIKAVDVSKGASVLPKAFAYPTVTTIKPDEDEPGYYPVNLPELGIGEDHKDEYEQTVDGQSLKITKVPTVNLGVWQSKLFVNTGVALETGTKYKVTANVTATKAFDLEICYNNGDVEKGYTHSGGDNTAALYGQNIGANEAKDFVYEFTANPSGDPNNLVLQFMVGKSPADNTITVNSVKIEKFVPNQPTEGYENVSITPSFREEHDSDSGYTQSLSGSALTISAVSSNPGVWKSKLFADTGKKLETGTKYKVTANVTATKAFDLEICYNNGSVEKGYTHSGGDNTAALYGQSIGANEAKDFVYEFTANPNGEADNLILQFQVGMSPADNTITVNSVKLEKWTTSSQTTDGHYEEVTGTNLSASEGHDDGYTQSVSGTALSITAIPTANTECWWSKLFVDTHTTLQKGVKYKVTANITSNKAASFEVCYNNGDVEKGYDHSGGDNTAALYGQSIGANETKDLVYEFTANPNGDAKNLVVQFQLGKCPADTTFTVNSVKLDKWSDGAGSEPIESLDRKSFELWAHEDYTATLSGDGNSATVTFGDTPEGSLESWKTKLFAETGAKLKAGKTYRITAKVKASKAFPYEICYNDGATENGVGNKGELTASTSGKTVTYDVTPDADKDLIIQFSLGNAAKGTTVTVSGIKVEELNEKTGDNLMKRTLKAWAPVHQWVDDGYKATLTNNSSSATMSFSSVAKEKADWKAKLFVETGAKLKAGKTYRIRYDLEASKSFKFNVFYNNGEEEKAVGEFYDLKVGKKNTITHTVSPAKDAELTIQLMLGNTVAPNKVKISSLKVEEAIGGSSAGVHPINHWAHEDYKVSLSNTNKSATAAIKKVPSSGREAWKVKLFVETGAKLKAGKTYRVSMDVKSSRAIAYEIAYNNQDQEAQLGAQYDLSAINEKSTVTYTVKPEQDAVLIAQLNLGNATGKTNVTVSNVKVQEIKYVSKTSVIPNFRYNSVGYVTSAADDGYVTSLTQYGNAATFRISHAPSGERKPWNAKVNIRTGVTPAPGKGCRVTFDVDAAAPQDLFEVFFDGNEEMTYGALYEQTLAPGKNTFSFVTEPNDGKGELYLQLRFGQTNGTNGNAYTISNVKIEEVTFIRSQRPEIKNTCELDVQEQFGYAAELTRTPEKAKVRLLQTPEEELEAWKNKLFVYTGAAFQPGEKYRVGLVVRSIIPAPFEVCYNNGDVEKGLGGIFGLTSKAEGVYVEYTTYCKEEAQLVIQLSLGNCTTPNTIFLSDVKVDKAGKINLASDKIYTF